ncbi:MAG: SDR family oxidoreductase [Rhodospirillales bacterium]|nr:SDR family oxidoreductase [Rhodospirillales bacterium]
MDLGLAGKIALITGASRGIGKAVAEELAAEGADVFLVGRTEADLAATAKAVRDKTKRRVETCAADLRNTAGINDVVAKLKATYGRVDILINNAGTARVGNFLEIPDDVWQDSFALKFFGCVRMCRALWPMLKESNGSVVNMSGTGFQTPSPMAMVGGSINAAVTNFSKALANLGLQDDVNVNSIHPGVIEGTLLDERNMAATAALRKITVEEIKKTRIQAMGIRRAGTTRDVAAYITFLASPAARHIQGTSAVIDGGAMKGL